MKNTHLKVIAWNLLLGLMDYKSFRESLGILGVEHGSKISEKLFSIIPKTKNNCVDL